MTATHYYIYYPIRLGLEADLARALYNLQDELHGKTGVAGRFLRAAHSQTQAGSARCR